MKNQIWTIILVSLVVAVIVSILTLSMTGNLIRVPTSVATTQADIYTKAEIDNLLKLYKCGPAQTIQLNEQKYVPFSGKVYTIKLVYLDPIHAQFNVGGITLTYLAKGESYKFSDGTIINLLDIRYQSFAGGVMSADIKLSC